MARTGILGIAGLLFTAASLVLLFFVVLAGVTHTAPLSKTYFLQADTSKISGARDVTQWTFFYFCGSGNQDCSKAHAAPPFGQAWSSHAKNVPSGISGSWGDGTSNKKYFFLWRFGWVFLLLALFFETLTFFSGFLACCGRLGSAISGILSGLGLFCFSAGASITTAAFVSAQKQFQHAGLDSHLGRYGFGFMWGAYAAAIIAQMLFCAGGFGNRDKSAASAGGGSGGGGLFSRKRSTRSYDGRRVKEEYA